MPHRHPGSPGDERDVQAEIDPSVITPSTSRQSNWTFSAAGLGIAAV
jgi:hypothetical protein